MLWSMPQFKLLVTTASSPFTWLHALCLTLMHQSLLSSVEEHHVRHANFSPMSGGAETTNSINRDIVGNLLDVDKAGQGCKKYCESFAVPVRVTDIHVECKILQMQHVERYAHIEYL